MSRLTAFLVAAARVLQVTLGFVAAGFAIALCQPWDAALAITVSAAYCSGGIAICGLLAMLALSQTPHIHWAMVLTLDLLSLACCGGAAGVLTYALANETDLFYSLDASTSPALTLPPLVLVYFCMAILSVLSARSFMFWVRILRRSPPEVQAKEAYEEQSWTPPVEQGHIPPRQYQALPSNQPRFSQDRHSDFKSSASTRPLSTVESLAYWSDVSGGATLTQAPSIRSSDTKSPPSYASPVPSRAPTTIHRKPLA